MVDLRSQVEKGFEPFVFVKSGLRIAAIKHDYFVLAIEQEKTLQFNRTIFIFLYMRSSPFNCFEIISKCRLLKTTSRGYPDGNDNGKNYRSAKEHLKRLYYTQNTTQYTTVYSILLEPPIIY